MRDRMDSGFFCLQMIGALHQITVDEAAIRHDLSDHLRPAVVAGASDLDLQAMLLAARQLGMSAQLVDQDPARLDKAPWPAVAQDRDGGYFVIAGFDSGIHPETKLANPKVLIQQAGQAPVMLNLQELAALWSGKVIFFTSRATFSGAMAKFDFTWFIPAIVKYRKLLGEVLVVSLFIQLAGLITPMFFQVVMDKVLVNHAMNTLNMIVIGLVATYLFEEILTFIRSWVFAHTSSKIDVELGARLFKHLLNLPMAYFESRRVGDSVARIRELENIRSFLTGNAITVVLDLSFSFVFLAVMYWYSPNLTWIVLASIPLYVLLAVVFTPVIQNRLNIKFNKGAENQSFLVETINGIGTIKASGVEPRWAYKWDQQLAGYVSSGLAVANVSVLVNGAISLISKLVTATILWVGTGLVIDNQLTVGALVAFNMLSGHVSQPIIRLAQLWNDFQQVGISMSRLGDILNSPTEISGERSQMPALQGGIEFDKVSFRYRPDSADVIRDIDLKIKPGEVIGIVGRSGSGKSTLTKLIQRLYVPQRGKVLIDGQDVAVIDVASLRRQTGVVLQENTLFNRSVRANIALTNPALPLDMVVQAAKLAGAHDFICELPEGYDSLIGEHGTGLSGGQRQRLAIARALISNPRILIFDEATSALDYESERIIQDNMRQICADRTVLIIAHRLSAVRDADRIIVMERGQIVETGTHEELLSINGGIYRYLHRLQHASNDPYAS